MFRSYETPCCHRDQVTKQTMYGGDKEAVDTDVFRRRTMAEPRNSQSQFRLLSCQKQMPRRNKIKLYIKTSPVSPITSSVLSKFLIGVEQLRVNTFEKHVYALSRS